MQRAKKKKMEKLQFGNEIKKKIQINPKEHCWVDSYLDIVYQLCKPGCLLAGLPLFGSCLEE